MVHLRNGSLNADGSTAFIDEVRESAYYSSTPSVSDERSYKEIGHAVVFASIYLALLLKVDVSGENHSSQEIFGVILVGVHGCMILAVVVQVMVLALSLRPTKHLEDPRPRPRRSSSLDLRIQPPIVEEDAAGNDGSPAEKKIELEV